MRLLGRELSHVTPTYVKDRVALYLFERRNPGQPWLTRTMIRILESLLVETDHGLEWGSGRSTLWLAARVARLTSVEHDAGWAHRVSRQLEAAGLANVDFRHVATAARESAAGEYVGVAGDLPNRSLDFCLVDGICRDHCARAVLPKLKPGGLLIIDNANWYIPRPRPSRSPNSRGLTDGYATPAWQIVGADLARWRCIWTTDGITDTALWIKPQIDP
jgi:predicted O-methyltransferase YrrM